MIVYSKYLPTDAQIKDFYVHHIYGNQYTYDGGEDIQSIVDSIKTLLKMTIDRVLSESSTVDMSGDHLGESKSGQNDERP